MKCINICFIFPLILLLSVAIAKPFPQQNDLGELDVADATDATDTTSQGEKDISSVNLNSGEAGTNSAAYGLDTGKASSSDRSDFIAESNTDTTIVALNGDKYLQNPESSAAYVGSQIASTPSQDTSSGFGILDKSFLVCPRESSPVCCGDGKPVDAEDRLQCKSCAFSCLQLCHTITTHASRRRSLPNGWSLSRH